jgi:hypothetical protein
VATQPAVPAVPGAPGAVRGDLTGATGLVGGRPSDHWTGTPRTSAHFATDPASGGGYGDEIARAAFLAAGEPVETARANARRGGLFTIRHGGLRIQIIWKTLEGGDHFHHVHVGVKREAGLNGERSSSSP